MCVPSTEEKIYKRASEPLITVTENEYKGESDEREQGASLIREIVCA